MLSQLFYRDVTYCTVTPPFVDSDALPAVKAQQQFHTPAQNCHSNNHYEAFSLQRTVRHAVNTNIYNLPWSDAAVHNPSCVVVAGLPYSTCQACYSIVVLQTIKVFCAVTPCSLQTAVSDQSQDFSIREHCCESPEMRESGDVRVRSCESPEL